MSVSFPSLISLFSFYISHILHLTKYFMVVWLFEWIQGNLISVICFVLLLFWCHVVLVLVWIWSSITAFANSWRLVVYLGAVFVSSECYHIFVNQDFGELFTMFQFGTCIILKITSYVAISNELSIKIYFSQVFLCWLTYFQKYNFLDINVMCVI